MQFIHLFPCVIFVVSLFNTAAAADTKGTIRLDSWTFDKVITKFDFTLVKIDVPYPYGEKQDEFAKVAEETRSVDELIIAEIGVKDYGDRENSDIAERFSLKKDDFPSILLFIKGQTNPIKFKSSNFKSDEIKSFIKQTTGLYIGLSSCIKIFDELAQKFVKAGKAERASILKEAQKATSGLSDSQKKSAEIYLKLMQKIEEKGDSFIKSELDRVANIQKQGKITKEKKDEMQTRINILHSFKIKDEL